MQLAKSYYHYTREVASKGANVIDPVVSICVMTYNQEDYILKCLTGIEKQKTNFPFEILIGEDDSKDSTRTLCADFVERVDNAKMFLHHTENKILLDGRPSGRFNFFYNLANCRGKYIAICEGDDYWTDPNKLQMQVDFMESHLEYGICYTDCDVIGDAAMKEAYRRPESSDFGFTDSLQDKGGPSLTMLFRRDALDLNLYIDMVRDMSMADWPLECFITKHNKGHRMNVSTAVYRRHDEGASVKRLSKWWSFYDSRFTGLIYFYEIEKDKYTKSLLARMLGVTYLKAAAAAMANSSRSKAVGFLKLAYEFLKKSSVGSYEELTTSRFSFKDAIWVLCRSTGRYVLNRFSR